MNKQNLVSIIIPTYNRSHLISDTLDSIAAQTYTNWECLIIDDHSVDDTEALIKTYTEKDSRFQFFKRPHDRPKGANSCRNFGFELSKGNYINWFDSDDIMLPNKIELQVQALQNHTQAPYCICQSFWFDKDKNLNLGMRSTSIDSKNRFEDYILQKIVWLTTVPLWRRQFIETNNLRFDESLHQSQEYDFHIRALVIDENYITVNKPLVKLIKHNSSISSNLYKDNLKINSHIKVKKGVLKNYHQRLSRSTKLKLYESFTLMFKDLLVIRKYNSAYKLLIVQVQMLSYLKISSYKKWFFLVQLMLAYITYRIFGKGYSLIKPLN
ncbi:glycosyltransferase family 2 protein [Aestuariivivens marinum]|uniref:glycosyltransferase family 2 protein n=1 Tax=Aestuariivivens marinum TaxID=2913555 RepID=UPI001F59F942|nr:glycosyltransferase family 2 protein [Aestuariivivens marinum]